MTGLTVAVAVFAWGMTRVLLEKAVVLGFLDVASERSSHEGTRARAGGIAFGLAFVLAIPVVAALQAMSPDTAWLLCIAAVALGTIGAIDDRFDLPAAPRFVVQLAVSALFVYAARDLWSTTSAPFVMAGVVTLGIVWFINLFNFMDGTDGLAAVEAIFLAGVILWLGWGSDVGAAALILISAVSGFLPANLPRARIFMGDAGSCLLGGVLAGLALLLARPQPSLLAVFLIASACFWLDATLTLLRRIFTRQSWAQPHRSHAYQKIARVHGHGGVLRGLLAVNLAWLMPWAWGAARWPDQQVWIVPVAIVPVGGLILRWHPGKPPENPHLSEVPAHAGAGGPNE